jgi:hypothetical protein
LQAQSRLKARARQSAAVTICCADYSRGIHSSGATVANSAGVRVNSMMDVVFIVALGLLYGATHWLVAAIARLQGGSP